MLLRTLAVIGLGGLAAVAGLTWLAFSPTPAVQSGPLVIEIPAHESVLGIATRLAEADVVHSRMAFLALTAGRGHIRHLKAGEYEIPRDATTLDVVDLLASGRVRTASAANIVTMPAFMSQTPGPVACSPLIWNGQSRMVSAGQTVS